MPSEFGTSLHSVSNRYFWRLYLLCWRLYSLPNSTVWKISPLMIAIATFGDVLLVLSGVYRLSRSERGVLKAPVVSTVTAVLLIMAAGELLAALGIVRPGPGVFFLGLIVLLGVSTVLVARFLFARPAD